MARKIYVLIPDFLLVSRAAIRLIDSKEFRNDRIA